MTIGAVSALPRPRACAACAAPRAARARPRDAARPRRPRPAALRRARRGVVPNAGPARIARCSVDDRCARRQSSPRLGVTAVLLFGIPEEKDEEGPAAWDEDGIVQRALRALRPRLPELACITDVCLCEYTTHGHCGVLARRRGRERRDARAARAHGGQPREAGADVVAPSDMMDGRVGAIREALDDAGSRRRDRRLLRRSTPRRSTARSARRPSSAPAFGDRRGYQMDPANVREALRECALDVAEGADVLMVKPALPYLDVIRAVRERFDCPVAAYNVSGEYAMVKAAAARRAGSTSGRRRSSRSPRSGAPAPTSIVTYWAKELAVGGSDRRRSHATALTARATRRPDPGRRQLAGARDAGGRVDEPLFVRRGEGAYLEDEDGNRYVDWVHVVGAADLRPRRRRDRRGRPSRRPRDGHDASARRPSARSSSPRRSSTRCRRSSWCGSSPRAPRRR